MEVPEQALGPMGTRRFAGWLCGSRTRFLHGLRRIQGALKMSASVGRSTITRFSNGTAYPRSGAPDLVADVSARALGSDRRGRFLHDGGVDVAGLVTFYTVFVIDLASRRVQIVESTPHPNDLLHVPSRSHADWH